MSLAGDTIRAVRNGLRLQEDIRQLNDSAKSQGERLTRLAEALGEVRDRVSRLEGIIEGAAMATRQRRIEE